MLLVRAAEHIAGQQFAVHATNLAVAVVMLLALHAAVAAHGHPAGIKTKVQRLLLDQLKQVAEGLGATFAPFCEVVVHDLSGRKVGNPATELGLVRILDPVFAQVIPNYANQFADGRQAKSTSIGIKDSSGQYIAALGSVALRAHRLSWAKPTTG